METMSEDAHSPYMETSSFMDEDFSQERVSIEISLIRLTYTSQRLCFGIEKRKGKE